MTKYYAGIGSRKTPKDVLEDMKLIGKFLANNGFCLRSGGAGGADQAFEAGCDEVNGEKEIFIPWKGFNGIDGIVPSYNDEVYEEVSSLHPAWHRCSSGARKLHCRNWYQVNGISNEEPSEFIVCWTPGGELVGGTAMAIRLAMKKNIPVVNLAKPNALKELMKIIKHEY